MTTPPNPKDREAMERQAERSMVLQTAKELGIVGWLSDDEEFFDFTGDHQMSSRLVELCQRYARATQEASIRTPLYASPQPPAGWWPIEAQDCHSVAEQLIVVRWNDDTAENITGERFAVIEKGERFDGTCVTHWMPLPAATPLPGGPQ